MEDQLLIGIDVGTTKVCTLVAREEAQGQLRILGVGIEPSQGLRKGVVVSPLPIDCIGRTSPWIT